MGATAQHTSKQWLGKPSYVRAYTAVNGSVLSTQVNYYGLTQPAPGQPAGTWLTWLSVQDEFPLGDVSYNANTTTPTPSAFVKRSVTEVDGIGDPVTQYHYGFYNLSGDERTSRMGYVHNWSNWIVGKQAYENNFSGISGIGAGEVFKNQTILYYDGNANYWDTPSLGQLKRVGSGNSGLGGANWAVQD